jgi:hypothetical protein
MNGVKGGSKRGGRMLKIYDGIEHAVTEKNAG